MVIHGGTTFEKQEAYLEYLRTKPLKIDSFTYNPGWKERLQRDLGDDYQVLLPKMPNTTNARYSEWETWFTHISELLTDDCILIGHSLGGIFLAKYLSEHRVRFSIKATILIAAPFHDDSSEDLTDFKIDSLTPLFEKQSGTIIFYNGADDPVVSILEQEQYKKFVPHAEFNTLVAPDHFVRIEFPELTQRIKDLQVAPITLQ